MAIEHLRRRTRRVSVARLPLAVGEFTAVGYRDRLRREHVALTHGRVSGGTPLVRVHSECLTGDAFGSLRCDCGEQLAAALDRIAAAGSGALVYLRGHEGRGIGLVNKLRAYEWQDRGLDTVDANLALGLPVDARDYRPAAAILRDLGIERLRLLTNNPDKVRALGRAGVDVVERVPLVVTHRSDNVRYLRTKATRMGHLWPAAPEA